MCHIQELEVCHSMAGTLNMWVGVAEAMGLLCSLKRVGLYPTGNF